MSSLVEVIKKTKKRTVFLCCILSSIITALVLDLVILIPLLGLGFDGPATPGFIKDKQIVSASQLAPLSILQDKDIPFNFPGEGFPTDTTVFDLEKPMLVYVHGWQKGKVVANQWENSNYQNSDPREPEEFESAKWRAKGWNVMIFNWVRFADEDDVFTAMEKIWLPVGGSSIRWRREDGSLERSQFAQDYNNMSVADILVARLRDLFANRTSNAEFRLVGHSLGTQVATRVASILVSEAAEHPETVPDRVELMDPFFPKKPLPGDASIQLQTRLEELLDQLVAADVPVTFYQTTALLDETPISLRESALLVRLDSDYISTYDTTRRHIAAPHHYWRAAVAVSESSLTVPDSGELSGFPSKLSNAEVLRLAKKGGASLVQKSGKKTYDTGDDSFELKSTSSLGSLPNLVVLLIGVAIPHLWFIFTLLFGTIYYFRNSIRSCFGMCCSCCNPTSEETLIPKKSTPSVPL